MGRQAYLAKIAFGRSAFEPTQSATQSIEYVQLESSQSELPRPYQEATANNYAQLYDERGNPINPRSHGYGKKLRDAQNDVLASVGVLERRRSSPEGLPGSYEEHLELLEAEDNVGNAVALASTITENLCTWWIGSIRDRLLTFRYQGTVPFVQLVASERAVSGVSLLYAGFASRLFSSMSIQAISYTASIYQPVERLLRLLRASPRKRSLFRWSRNALKSGVHLCSVALFYPFSYHSSLQLLGLVPASPLLLPSWDSLVPFSRRSPLVPFSSQYDASASVFDCLKAALTSPVILICVEHFVERWVCSLLDEAIKSSIIRPDNADIQSRDIGDRDWATTIHSPRRVSPPLLRNTVNTLLIMLGWGQALTVEQTRRDQNAESAHRLGLTDGETIDVGSTRITNVTQLDIPIAQTQDPAAEPLGLEVITIPIDAIDEMIRPITPPSPTASVSDQDDNDPRIRITSREGIVEMEVRLPPRILSTHTEVVNTLTSSSGHQATASRNATYSRGSRSRHRVTQLSSEPAQMISAIVKAQLVGLVMLPLRLVTLRTIASHHLASQGGHAKPPRIVRPFPDLHDLSWRTITVQISRLALCAALELSIDLGLWGMQYLAITNIGRSIFGWGTL